MKIARSWLARAVFALGMAMSMQPANAQFEVEEPEVEKGELELRYDGDYNFGIPKRRIELLDGGEEVAADDNEQARQRHTIQLGMGLSDWLAIEVGAEFEEERREEVRFPGEKDDYLKLRGSEIEGQVIFEIVPLNGNGIGLSLLGEATTNLQESGSSFGIGPIVKYQNGPFSATANLFFVKAFGGDNEVEEDDDGNEVVEERFDDRWDFEYGWQLAYEMNAKWSMALEGYGTIERLGDSGWSAQATGEVIEELAELGVSHRRLFRDHDQHRIGPVVYYKIGGEEAKGGDDDDEGGEEDEAPSLTLGVGVLFGLNEDTPDTALKWSLEAEF